MNTISNDLNTYDLHVIIMCLNRIKAEAEFFKLIPVDSLSEPITRLIKLPTIGISFELVDKIFHDTFQVTYNEF